MHSYVLSGTACRSMVEFGYRDDALGTTWYPGVCGPYAVNAVLDRCLAHAHRGR